MTERVEVVSGPFTHDGEQYHNGDKLEVPESVLDHYPRSLDVVESTVTDTQEAEDSEKSAYTRDELESLDWSELRSLAVESDREDIDGRTAKDDIIDALAED